MAFIYENRGSGSVFLENGGQDRTLASGSIISLEEEDATLSKLFNTPALLRHKIRSVPGTASSFVDVYDELTLTEDTTVAGSVKWNCKVNNVQITDFLSPSSDAHYTTVIKDGRGNIISSSLYTFNYTTGVLTFTTRPKDQGFTFPFRAKLFKSSGFSGGSGTFETGNGQETGVIFTEANGTTWVGRVVAGNWVTEPYP